MSDVVILSCSPSQPSKTAKLGEHVAFELRRLSITSTVLSLRDLPAAPLLRGDLEHPTLAAARHQVAEARGIVIATPIFKAAYSGLLKVFLDVLPQYALTGKVVLPLATGGSLAHVLALDYALRPVLQSMAPLNVLPSLFLLDKTLLHSNGTDLCRESLTDLDATLLRFRLALPPAESIWHDQAVA